MFAYIYSHLHKGSEKIDVVFRTKRRKNDDKAIIGSNASPIGRERGQERQKNKR